MPNHAQFLTVDGVSLHFSFSHFPRGVQNPDVTTARQSAASPNYDGSAARDCDMSWETSLIGDFLQQQQLDEEAPETSQEVLPWDMKWPRELTIKSSQQTTCVQQPRHFQSHLSSFTSMVSSNTATHQPSRLRQSSLAVPGQYTQPYASSTQPALCGEHQNDNKMLGASKDQSLLHVKPFQSAPTHELQQQSLGLGQCQSQRLCPLSKQSCLQWTIVHTS